MFGNVWVLGVGSCDSMSRDKHRLGRDATGSDRRDPQTWSYRQHIVRNAVKVLNPAPISGFRGATVVPLRAEFSRVFGAVFAACGLCGVYFWNP